MTDDQIDKEEHREAMEALKEYEYVLRSLREVPIDSEGNSGAIFCQKCGKMFCERH